MGELGALRRAGRARGVEDDRGVVAGAVGDLAERIGRGERLLELAGRDDHAVRARGRGTGPRVVREPVPGEQTAASGSLR